LQQCLKSNNHLQTGAQAGAQDGAQDGAAPQQHPPPPLGNKNPMVARGRPTRMSNLNNILTKTILV
jgi:hypothetical protein